MSSKNLILIPGAWSDSTVWKFLQTELAKLEIRSYSLTLSGLNRNDEHKRIDLKTHVDNVITFLDSLEIDNLYLVGHSYSGFVASLVAEQIPYKISGLIFVEAFLPENQKSLLEMAGLDVEEEIKGIEKNNGSWPPPTREEISFQPYLTDSHIEYLVNNMKGHPGKTVRDKANITGDTLNELSTHYIGGNLSDIIKENPNFNRISFYKLDGGHWPMLTKPRELAEIIQTI